MFFAEGVKDLYGVTSIPATFFFDRTGRMRLKELGFNPKDGEEKFSIIIEELLKETTAAAPGSTAPH